MNTPKKLLIFSLFTMVFTGNVVAYCPVLGDSIAKWTTLVSSEYPYSLFRATFGDTVINHLNYKKVYTYDYIDDGNLTNERWLRYIPKITNNQQLQDVFLRETTGAAQLFLLDTQKNEEYLIYDISLNKGDTFALPPYASFYRYSFDVATVDSVYYDTKGLKHICFDGPMWDVWDYRNFEFIEGVGPNADILYACEHYNGSYAFGAGLHCFKNDTVIYITENNYVCGCNINFLDVQEQKINSCKIEVQSNTIQLQFDSNINRNIKLYTMSGQQIYQIHNNAIIVDIPIVDMPQGMYFIQITDNQSHIVLVSKITL
jgi:hypothetical protein